MNINRSLFYTFCSITCWLFCSCGEVNTSKQTPESFLSYTVAPRAQYVKDSLQILDTLYSFLSRHDQSFNTKDYFDSTQIIIDTIVYNESLDKLAVLIMTRNPTYRQLTPDTQYAWYYDATSYIGIRKNEDIELAWVGPNFSSSYDSKELSEMIRQAVFSTLAKKDTTGGNGLRYNMNDVRFWDSAIWEKKFQGK